MLTKVNLLLTYKCNLECDHCYRYCSPRAEGTFTLEQIRKVLDELIKIETIEAMGFNGGEPFLFYPLMLEGIKIARDMGFKAVPLTNGYWATAVEDAKIWLRPLGELGVPYISMSDDFLHYEDERDSPSKAVLIAAEQLGLSVKTTRNIINNYGRVMFMGRAADKLAEGMTRRHWEEFTQCSKVDFENPERIFLDSYGNVHLCFQGLSIGNMWETPLSTLLKKYNADLHPICGPLYRGGPALLAKEYDVNHEDEYVDQCHMCYLVRLALIDRFPQYLAPRQVYGLE
jgi:organic radical activating enzyme